MEEAALDIFLPVMESATVLAAHYAKACGRDIIMAEDMRMGLMFAARNVMGKHIGSLYPEIYDESDSEEDPEFDPDASDSDSGSWETVSDSELVWSRYDGTGSSSGEPDDMATKMNQCEDTWEDWEPETPAERALKNAVNKQREN
jgi:hypothetical protein